MLLRVNALGNIVSQSIHPPIAFVVRQVPPATMAPSGNTSASNVPLRAPVAPQLSRVANMLPAGRAAPYPLPGQPR